MAEYKEIPIELIDEPDMPLRSTMDPQKLEELAEDIKQNGIIEPLIVSERTGRYAIWAGHRRYIAARLAYLRSLPCVVRTEAELPHEAAMLSENFLRDDPSRAEVGWWVLELVKRFHLSMPELCQRLRRSEQWIQECVDLVETDGEVAKAVAEKQINFAVAKELCRCKDEAHRRLFLKLAIEHGTTARTVRYQVDQWKRTSELPQAGTKAVDPQTPPVPEDIYAPFCVLCGLKDSPQNMVQMLVHYYHWEPVKKFLKDNGFNIFA